MNLMIDIRVATIDITNRVQVTIDSKITLLLHKYKIIEMIYINT